MEHPELEEGRLLRQEAGGVRTSFTATAGSTTRIEPDRLTFTLMPSEVMISWPESTVTVARVSIGQIEVEGVKTQ